MSRRFWVGVHLAVASFISLEFLIEEGGAGDNLLLVLAVRLPQGFLGETSQPLLFHVDSLWRLALIVPQEEGTVGD